KENIININDVIQVGNDLYLGMSGGIDDKIRHCCFPTAYLSVVGNRFILNSLYIIKTNMEITYDYSLNNTDVDLNQKCTCGHILCRKQITDYNSLDQSVKDRYSKLKITPLHIQYSFFQKFQ